MTAANPEEYNACKLKYRRLRALTQEVVEEEAFRELRLKIVAKPVDEEALKFVDDVWDRCGTPRRVSFRWRAELMPILEKSHPRRLDVAFWHEQQLCGIMIARLSDAREWLSLTHIEGNPSPNHALRGYVVPLSLVAATQYAVLIKAEAAMTVAPAIRILNPLPQSMAAYERWGYSEVHQANGFRRYHYATFQPTRSTP